jgi:hypothetical protein
MREPAVANAGVLGKPIQRVKMVELIGVFFDEACPKFLLSHWFGQAIAPLGEGCPRRKLLSRFKTQTYEYNSLQLGVKAPISVASGNDACLADYSLKRRHQLGEHIYVLRWRGRAETPASRVFFCCVCDLLRCFRFLSKNRGDEKAIF